MCGGGIFTFLEIQLNFGLFVEGKVKREWEAPESFYTEAFIFST